MTELEDRIRSALADRAAATHPTRDALAAGRPRRPWVAPLLAAAAVLILAAAALVIANVRTGGNDSSPAAGDAFYVGSTWRVVSLHDFDGPLDVSADIDATISYHDDGTVTANDTVNALSSRYTLGETTYSLGDAGTTYALYAGHDPTRLRVISAVDKLFFNSAAGTPNPGAAHMVIKVSGSGDSLVLQTTGTEVITVTLERVGPADRVRTTSPTPTTSEYVGQVWQVQTFRRNATTSGTVGCVQLRFGNDGSLTAPDGVGGTFTGSYRTTDSGFTVSDANWTGFGSTIPPLRAALSELFLGNADLRQGSGPQASASVDGNTLTVTYATAGDDVRITAERSGPAPDPSTSSGLPPGFGYSTC